jgi:phosphoribosylamine---glycine ligase
MNILLLGSGGREHALAWKMSQSPLLKTLYALPGNPGIAQFATCLPGDPSDVNLVVQTAQKHSIDFVVVGPEAPLVNGVVDALTHHNILSFGPTKEAARIEGSKAFAKELMASAEIPTARSETFTNATLAAARALEWGAVVVKADGLAAGKGVIVCESGKEAAAACEQLGHTQAGATLLLEEKLSGPEISVMALCDGSRYALLPTSQDHKRLFDGDSGPNTGGMGAFSPSSLLSAAQLHELSEAIFPKILSEMAKRNCPFRGVLYCGLMLTPTGPKVLEFNARLGDPETQVLMMQLDEDLIPLLLSCAKGLLTKNNIKQKSSVSVGVVMAARDYPQAPKIGDSIWGLDTIFGSKDIHIFQAGTSIKDKRIVTNGGRVLTVCAQADTMEQARALAYQSIESIQFQGAHFRRDIAKKHNE